MTRTEAIALIEELLGLYANKNYDTIHKVMIFQRGYLTGILADLIRDDFYVEQKIRSKISQAKKP